MTVPTAAPASEEGCYSSTTYAGPYATVLQDCFNSTVNPTVLSLADGDLAVAYQYDTNVTDTNCPSAAGDFDTEVGFSLSSDGGQSFASPTVLGNNSCPYPDAMEPSFAALGSHVYGVFVVGNWSAATAASYSPAAEYWDRYGDALDFVSSSNSGATFGRASTIDSLGNVAHPELAAFGKTLYVLFENLSNTSTYGSTFVSAGGPYCGTCTVTPASIDFIRSTDGGATWSSPTTLPELNVSAAYFSIGSDLAVNATGTLAATYFTNQHCVWNLLVSCYDYGLDLVVSTSTDNGTTWHGPTTIAPNVGESYWIGPNANYFGPPPQWAPASDLTFSANGQRLFVTWEGAFSHASVPSPVWGTTGVYFASGASTGGGWSVETISETNVSGLSDAAYLPSIGVGGGRLYLSFEKLNTTTCGIGACSYLDNSISDWVQYSTDGGVSWTGPTLVALAPVTGLEAEEYLGTQSSVAVTSSGAPIVAYPAALSQIGVVGSSGNTTWFNFSYPVVLRVAVPYSGPVVTVNFTEAGLPSPRWSFLLEGGVVAVNGSRTFVVPDVPVGFPVLFQPIQLSPGYGEQEVGTTTAPVPDTFLVNSTVSFNYSVFWQVQLYLNPVNSSGGYSWTVGTTTYTVYQGWTCVLFCTWTGTYWATNAWPYPPTLATQNPPWYFTNGTVLALGTVFSNGINLWNGTGPGSFTGVGPVANVTVTGPINETAWVGSIGRYDERFVATNLPSSSSFHLEFAGENLTGTGSEPAVATNVSTGAYPIPTAWANSSLPGWEYFGRADVGSTALVPAQPVVNLSFALVDLSSPLGAVSFHAVGVPSGAVWHLEFNGTEYGATVPWINVTARSGTYALAGFPVVSSNGSVGLAPSGWNSTIAVVPGATYPLAFDAAFLVRPIPGVGGAIAGGAALFWAVAGTSVSFDAVAASNYVFGGWTGNGSGSYTGPSAWANFTVEGPTTEAAAFFPVGGNRFNLTFAEAGLAAGTWWTVFVGGAGYSTNQTSFIVPDLFACGRSGGVYTLSVPYAYGSGANRTRYAPTPYPSTICTTGATIETLEFTTQSYLTLGSTSGGWPVATLGDVSSTVSLWAPDGATVDLGARVLTGYDFVGWNGSGPNAFSGPTMDASLTVAGPATETAVFEPAVAPAPLTFSVVVTAATPFENGTVWSLVLNGTLYSTTSSTLAIDNVRASATAYAVAVPAAYSPDGTVRYQPLSPPSSVTVEGNVTLSLAFALNYWVRVTSEAGGTVVLPAPSGAWYPSGATVELSASEEVGYAFLGWAGTGPGAYTGDLNPVNVTVEGPISEVASFGTTPPQGSSTSASSPWASPALWVGLAAVGLAVGLLVGRYGRRPPIPPAAPDPANPSLDSAPTGGASDDSPDGGRP